MRKRELFRCAPSEKGKCPASRGVRVRQQEGPCAHWSTHRLSRDRPCPAGLRNSIRLAPLHYTLTLHHDLEDLAKGRVAVQKHLVALCQGTWEHGNSVVQPQRQLLFLARATLQSGTVTELKLIVDAILP